MQNFIEWKKKYEQSNLTELNHTEQQDVWNVVHGLGPILKTELKRLIAKVTTDFERNEMQNFPNSREILDIATSQILLDLTREYDPMQ